MTADHFLFYCDIFVECREQSTSVFLLTTTRKGKREIGIGKERWRQTDIFFLTHAFFDWIFWCVMKEQNFLRPCFCCSFFHHHRAYTNFWTTRGETDKKKLRKNETKRHNCACDWLWYEEYTMFWGRKKKEEEKQQQPKKKKICCACPETKEPRDQCVGEFGAEDERCKKLVEAHLVCLRKEGFDVWFRVTHWWWFC